MKNAKTVLAFLLAMVMLLSVVPIAAYAKDCEHKWVAGDVVEPTCEEAGYTPYTCSVCDATDKRDFVLATGHRTFACSDADESTHICTDCGKPFAHSFNEWSYDGNNGFFKDGTESRHCCDKGCGYEEHRMVENTSTFHKIVSGATGFGAFLLAASLSPLSWIVKTFNPALHQQIEDAIRDLLAQK